MWWIPLGDDGVTGKATTYDLRISTAGAITATNFATATRITIKVPGDPLTTELVTITVLLPNTKYWFALKAADEVPNWAPVSNSPTATTQI